MTAKMLCRGAACAMVPVAHLAAGPVTFYTDEAAFDAATTTSIVVTFDEAAWDPLEFTEFFGSFTFNGITFTPLSSPPFAPNLFISMPRQDNFCCPPETRVLTSTGNEEIRLTFDEPPSAAGFDFWSNNGVPAIYTVVLADDSVHTFPSSQTPETIGFVGFTADPPIKSIEWLADVGEEMNTGIDNVRTTATACPEDLDGDGMVGPGDLAVLLAAWNEGEENPADLDGDGTVGAGDLAVLLAAWGPCD